MDWFAKQQAEDPMFFYSIDFHQTVKGNKPRNIFWANSRSRSYYENYRDCISFDTTYNTNRYNMKFAPIVGIT